MEWKHAQYWQKISYTAKVWHIDDSTVTRWVTRRYSFITLCGREYTEGVPREVYDQPEGQPICKRCQKEMVKLILRLGLPIRGDVCGPLETGVRL